MTEEKEFIFGEVREKKRSYLVYLPIAAFLICIAAGTYIGGDGGAFVRLENPFDKDTSFFLLEWVQVSVCLFPLQRESGRFEEWLLVQQFLFVPKMRFPVRQSA